MNCLLIEDDPNKAKQVIDFLNEYYPAWDIKTCRSYQSGLESIFENEYDLILLDMSLPNFDISPKEDGYVHKQLAGQEILRELKRKRRFVRTVVVTQFDAFGENSSAVSLESLKSNLKSSFPESYIGTIYYKAGQTQWKKELLSILDNVANS